MLNGIELCFKRVIVARLFGNILVLEKVHQTLNGVVAMARSNEKDYYSTYS